ncbi:SPOR domain-containing protein [Salinispirillum sp. LH 10-3-1]|uniref:SPOR domain-containing protein n=1 Tax=Salinispirillum sp. LH 10-3-1 TaxID=2952525 RepID=A0AB38YEZ5_9GAMM
MARDYAQKKRAPRAAPRSEVPRWVWIFTTTVALCFAGFLYLLSQQPAGEPLRLELPTLSSGTASTTPSTAPRPEPTRPAPAPAPSRQEQLEFYTLLQQTDVLVPDSDLVLRERPAPGTPTAPGTETAPLAQYMVQVASFSRRTDADALRAQLILEGLTSAHITQADLGDRGVFHRVMIGPVSGSREAAGVANTLERMGLQGLVRNHTVPNP